MEVRSNYNFDPESALPAEAVVDAYYQGPQPEVRLPQLEVPENPEFIDGIHGVEPTSNLVLRGLAEVHYRNVEHRFMPWVSPEVAESAGRLALLHTVEQPVTDLYEASDDNLALAA